MLGIIPARAGFTDTGAQCTGENEDHPRSRGVYIVGGPDGSLEGGSSPLARGLRCSCSSPARYRGIIPARAGFTVDDAVAQHRVRDHPRSRGVYSPAPAYLGPRAGSSPLARGLPGALCEQAPVEGIIPARAGFTPMNMGVSDCQPDHPRSRGVYGV